MRGVRRERSGALWTAGLTTSMDAAQSFTNRVVAELAPHTPLLPCCRRALVDGLALVTSTPGAIATTRPAAVRAAMQALHAERITAHVSRVGAARRTQYVLVGIEPEVVQTRSTRTCCTRSRLRGAFLGAGRLVRPDGEPYLEVGCADEDAAVQLVADFATLGIGAQMRLRRGRWVVTVRSGAAVGAALSSIGAQAGRLTFESGRVIREVRSGVNRRLNAETANLRRSAVAGVRQVEFDHRPGGGSRALARAAAGAAGGGGASCPPSGRRPGAAGGTRRLQPSRDGRPLPPSDRRGG